MSFADEEKGAVDIGEEPKETVVTGEHKGPKFKLLLILGGVLVVFFAKFELFGGAYARWAMGG